MHSRDDHAPLHGARPNPRTSLRAAAVATLCRRRHHDCSPLRPRTQRRVCGRGSRRPLQGLRGGAWPRVGATATGNPAIAITALANTRAPRLAFERSPALCTTFRRPHPQACMPTTASKRIALASPPAQCQLPSSRPCLKHSGRSSAMHQLPSPPPTRPGKKPVLRRGTKTCSIIMITQAARACTHPLVPACHPLL